MVGTLISVADTSNHPINTSRHMHLDLVASEPCESENHENKDRSQLVWRFSLESRLENPLLFFVENINALQQQRTTMQPRATQ